MSDNTDFRELMRWMNPTADSHDTDGPNGPDKTVDTTESADNPASSVDSGHAGSSGNPVGEEAQGAGRPVAGSEVQPDSSAHLVLHNQAHDEPATEPVYEPVPESGAESGAESASDSSSAVSASGWGEVLSSLSTPTATSSPTVPVAHSGLNTPDQQVASTGNGATSTTGDNPTVSSAAVSTRPTGASHAAKGAPGARDVQPGDGEPSAWVRRTTFAVIGVLVVGGAIIAGRGLMGSDEPVTATAADSDTSDSSESSDSNGSGESGVSAASGTDTAADSSNSARAGAGSDGPGAGLPDDQAVAYAGTCSADQIGDGEDAQEITPSGKSLRSRVADFQGNYFSKNVEGLKATIDESNKPWRDQDWGKILRSIPDDASWCLTMAPLKSQSAATATTVESTVVMSAPGVDSQTFTSQVRGRADESGLWKVTEMTSVK